MYFALCSLFLNISFTFWHSNCNVNFFSNLCFQVVFCWGSRWKFLFEFNGILRSSYKQVEHVCTDVQEERGCWSGHLRWFPLCSGWSWCSCLKPLFPAPGLCGKVRHKGTREKQICLPELTSLLLFLSFFSLSLSPSVPYFPHSFLYISFYSILTLFNFILHNSFFPSA